MLLQTNSYIVPKERRAEHARMIRRFRQALSRIGCDQFEVYEQVGANWSPGGANGRYVQIMRFRDRHHQQAVQAAEREDHGAQQIIAEFCDLINFPYQQQHGYFATGFYTSVLPIGPRQEIEAPAEEAAHEEAAAAEEVEAAADEPTLPEEGTFGEEAVASTDVEERSAELPEVAEEELASPLSDEAHEEALAEVYGEAPADELPEANLDEEAALAEEPVAPMEEMTAHVAAEGVVAEAFLDSLSEEDLPPEELSALEELPTDAAQSHDAPSLEDPFAEAPIASEPLIEGTAEEALVTADSFVTDGPSTHDEAGSGHGVPRQQELHEIEEVEAAPAGHSEISDPFFGEQESMPSAAAPLPEAGVEGLEFGEVETTDDADFQAHLKAMREGAPDEHEAPTEAEPLGLDFAPLAHEPAAEAVELVGETPFGDNFDGEIAHDMSVSAEHQAPAEANAPSEPVDEFSMDEGLIFDEEEHPAGDVAPSEPAIAPPHHAEAPGFDAVLENANVLADVPLSGNGHGVRPAPGVSRRAVNPAKDAADLRAFEEFLRQLDSKHEQKSH